MIVVGACGSGVRGLVTAWVMAQDRLQMRTGFGLSGEGWRQNRQERCTLILHHGP
jgi:hypothetical protein